MNSPIPFDGIDLSQKFHFRVEQDERGPCDLIELAGHLRCGDIAPTTPVRRDGETEWQPLENLPEYASLQAMPIETIARHLEQKEKGRDVKRTSNLWLTGTILVVLGAAITLAVVIFTGNPPPTPRMASMPTGYLPPTGWVRTGIGGFTIECPTQLEGISSPTPNGVHSYRAHVPGAGFGVDMQVVPGNYSPAEYNSVFDQTQQLVLTELNAQLESQASVMINGLPGRDIMITQDFHGHKLAGGFRILAGHGKLGVAWAVAHSTDYDNAQIRHYITSFRFN